MIQDPKERLVALQKARDELEKRIGKGATLKGNEKVEVPIICSTGSFNIDLALGVMGIPAGKIIEIYGPESSGKTTLCLHIIREAQKKGYLCSFVDAEHALDLSWARKIGCNTDELLISQPDCGEEALQVCESIVDSQSNAIIVIDSVAALTPRAEIEGEFGASQMGLQARLMSQAMRKLTAKISNAGCTVIFTNQIRSKIGVMYGSPETVTGGNALKFYASIRLDVRRINSESTVDAVEGQTTAALKIKVVKNKVSTPFKVAETELDTGNNGIYGFNKFKEVFDVAVKSNIIEKRGNTYLFGEERIGVGRENAASLFMENKEMFEQVKNKVMNIFNAQNDDIILQGSFAQTIQTEQVEEGEKKQRKGRKPKEFQGELVETKLVDDSIETVVPSEEIVE